MLLISLKKECGLVLNVHCVHKETGGEGGGGVEQNRQERVKGKKEKRLLQGVRV